MVCRKENIIFGKGGGVNIVFGPKYRPLDEKQRKDKWFVLEQHMVTGTDTHNHVFLHD
jgi:hypothetical protein